jgi:aminobenzoyl-glutamate transport protein
VVEPRLGPYTGDGSENKGASVSSDELRGLKFAMWGLAGFLVVFALLALPPHAPLRNPDTGALVGDSPFMNGLIVFIALLF